MKLALALILVVALIAGCIGQTVVTSDLSITAGFDPSTIKASESSTLFIDVENKGIKSINNLSVEVFDTGILYVSAPTLYSCKDSIPELRPSQVGSIECQLAVANKASLMQQTTAAAINFKTSFQKSISGTFLADAITQTEFRRLERIGTLQQKPQSLTFGDSQLQATLQFNKQPPFIAGETVIGQLSIINIGPGRIYTLEPSSLTINQSGSEFECGFTNTLLSSNGQFVPITCTFNTPSDIATIATYPITLELKYDYEITQTASLTIEKS